MNNLIKNELTKIFHKKAIYIIAIITIIVGCLDYGIIKLSGSMNKLYENDTTMKYIEDSLSMYDLNNPNDASNYVEDKTMIDVYKATKNYSYESFEYYMLNDKGYEYLSCMNHEKYVTKNEEEYKKCEASYNQLLKDLKEKDWKYFVNQNKEMVEEQIKTTEASLKIATEETDKTLLESELKILNIRLQGINYSLERNIYPSNKTNYSFISMYEGLATEWESLEKDEKTYTDRNQLLNKRDVEKNFKEYNYIIENNIDYSGTFSAKNMMIAEFSGPILFVLVMIIFIAGSIVSDEYNKGTIKQLLLRPFSRTKILASKYISCLIVFLMYTIFYAVVCMIAYGLASGFSSLVEPVVVYDFVSASIVEMGLIPYLLLQFVSVLPVYLIILTLAFFISTFSGNTALSIMVPFMTYFISSIISGLASSMEVKMLKFFPTMCWNFNEYLFGGMPSFKYASLGTSIAITILTFLILFILSFILFKKKDIKNQ